MSTTLLTSYAYSDGSGGAVMTKVRAEDGRAVELNPDGSPKEDGEGNLIYDDSTSPRWVGSGRTVFDNKGNPIKQYEPYFSATAEYEDDPDIVEWGVTPLLHYDPVGRLIRTDLPNGSYSYVTFDPWQQTAYDPNDTAKTGQRWYDDRIVLQQGDPERVAAEKANAHADTPTRTYFDALGRAFLVREMLNTTPTYVDTKAELDIQGNVVAVVDALGRDAVSYVYGMIGQLLEQATIDAGSRWLFTTPTGQLVKRWGQRNYAERAEYDALRRVTKVYVHDGSTEKLVEERIYGEGSTNEYANNLKGRLLELYDQSGKLVTGDYDFKGNLEHQERWLADDYQNVLDWSAQTPPTLSNESFVHEYAYDALNRPTSVKVPDNPGGNPSEVLPSYNIAGLLESVQVYVRGAGTATPIVESIAYDEKGRRTKIVYSDTGDDYFYTEYEYDEYTFRLKHFKTTRTSGDPDPLLQSLAYTYDAAGNIVSTHDTATQSVYFSTTLPIPAQADGEFTYDALYRLVEAKGREHAGTAMDVQHDEIEDPPYAVPHPNNPNGFRAYTQSYAYDKVGNITSMSHDVPAQGWSRAYTYTSGTNRLATVSHPGGTRSFPHDAHGNITAMAHLNSITWDFADQMRHVNIASGQDVYFVYDASGQRVRKVWITNSGNLRRERIYLGGYEVWRSYDKVSGNWVLKEERETLHVADDARRVCMVETLTVTGGSAPNPIVSRLRFQLDNHLGTCCVEVDQVGAVISYEEYHPYGTSAYRAFKTPGGVSAKRYRYTGKERDEETSLYYHGARYYAPWLGRWTQADPAGTVDGTNLYAYVRGSPVVLTDPSGTQSEAETQQWLHNLDKGIEALKGGGGEAPTPAKAETPAQRLPLTRKLDAPHQQGVAEAATGVGKGVASLAWRSAGVVVPLLGAYQLASAAWGAYERWGADPAMIANETLNPAYGLTVAGIETVEAIKEGDVEKAAENITVLAGTAAEVVALGRAASKGRAAGTFEDIKVNIKPGDLPQKPTGTLPESPKGSVKPWESGTVEDLRGRSAVGDKLDIDHIPSNASNVARAEANLGRALTPRELRTVELGGTGMAVPKGLHQGASRTYGGRNKPAQIARDAADPVGAAELDVAAYRGRVPQSQQARFAAGAAKLLAQVRNRFGR